MNPRKNLDAEVAGLWERLEGAQGRKYWRSLDELADSDAFRDLMQREFPEQASVWPEAINRRRFLTLMGASLALAGVTGCSVRPAPSRDILPYVRAPEEIVPGRPLFYATAMTLGGTGVGLLVESHMGRPTKIEGNPEHPASQGATDPFHQASILTFYDPDRSHSVTFKGETRTWNDALVEFRRVLKEQRKSQGAERNEFRSTLGAGVRVLTENVISPSLIQQLDEFLKMFPQARWHQYEPLARDNACRAAVLAYGKPVNTVYDFTRADVVVAFDADFLSCLPGNLHYVSDFMSRRRVRTTDAEAKSATMNRLYAIETMVTNTGAKADHRLAVRPSRIEAFVRALAVQLKVPDASGGADLDDNERSWIGAVADDLRQRGAGNTVVLAGDGQPPAVHLMVEAINRQLGNVGQTVLHTPAIEAQPAVRSGQTAEGQGGQAQSATYERLESLRHLMNDLDAGKVELLLILGGNPVFTAPADFDFVERMQKAKLRVHHSLYQDETSRWCHWHLPEAHFLEAWSDTRAYDGTISIVQPLIEPLYEGRSAHELIGALTPVARQEEPTGSTWNQLPGYEIVKGYWRSQKKSKEFESFWQETVHDGVMADTAHKHQNFDWQSSAGQHLGAGSSRSASSSQGYELLFQPDPTIYDGRFANNGWLQELPKPITKLTWDNAVLMSPTTARQLGIDLGSYAHGGEHGGYDQPMVELQVKDRKVRGPAWIVPGHADGCITVNLGYGREYAGRVGGQNGEQVGFNAYLLRTSDHLWYAPGLEVRRTGATYLLACTQEHQSMENRETVRVGKLADYHDEPRFAEKKDKEKEEEATRRARQPLPLSLYESPPNAEYNKWGMIIDLTTCTGCKACVVACQAENNIPVVGKEQVLAGREMHWIRVDRYISGPYDRPTEFHFQPVPCMHCENAPCEYVCPVEATVHSADGLNEMLYQRCVGTRFCSNNCPYKVRRFNFLSYGNFTTPSLKQQYNPDVTVRSRGVMEKCSYCVQRIRHAQIDSQVQGRNIVDGEVLTACQAACPAQAIVFGDMNDKTSKVTRWKESPLHYGLLADINTQPRTTYLAALRNPNPALTGR